VRALSGRGQAVGRAAAVYFALVFAAGFALGTVRVLAVAPCFGELAAVLCETPVMLGVSWLACGAAIRAFGVRGRGAGLAMGAAAFALLMAAEAALAVAGFGRSPAEFLHAFGSPAGAVGLAGQVAFGVFPLLRAGGSDAP
jgi:hypothetical protein